jgi:hypothetical protein
MRCRATSSWPARTKATRRVVGALPRRSTPVTAACLLRDRALVGLVEAALLRGAGMSYELFASAIMPNHVHVLIAPAAGSRPADIVHA